MAVHDEALWSKRLEKRRQGTTWSAIADEEDVKWGTFSNDLRAVRQLGWIPPEEELPRSKRRSPRPRGTHEIPLGVPRKEPVTEPERVPIGTNRGSLEGTVMDEEVDFPLADEIQHQTLENLAEALLPLVLSGVEAWLETRVPQRVPIGVSEAAETIPMRRYPQGTPGYPADPRKDSRLNLHLRAGELWEVHAVAEAMQTSPSYLMRWLWTHFMASTQAQEALQRYLDKRDTSMGTSEGTS
jgi:hypothetical protein